MNNKNKLSIAERFWIKNFGNLPEGWGFTLAEDLLSDSTATSNDKKKYPLYSLTIEDGVTPKTDRYEREFLLKDAENNEYKIVENGQIVFNPMNLRFGAIALAKLNRPVTVSGYYNVLKINESSISSEYLINTLKTPFFKYLYETVATGSLNEKKRVHWSDFKKLHIPMPLQKREQEKIAKILSAWDEAIENLTQLINKKQLARNLIIEDIFTKKKSLGFKTWMEVKISDLCEINSQNISNQDQNFYYVDLSSVSSGEIVYPNETINKNEAPSRAKRKCQKNDILISNVRPNLQGFAVIDWDAKNLVASTGFSVLRTKGHYIHVVYSAFYSTSIANQINSVVTGSSYPAMNSSDVANFSIRVPKDESEAKKLGQILKCSEYQIKTLKDLKIKLKLQKQALMQQLLTGKKRVKV